MKSSKALEWILNISSVICVLLVVAILVHRYAFPALGWGMDNDQLRIGSKIPIRDIDWHENRSTLVMALSVSCGYCKKSAGFYRDLIASNIENRFHPIAIFPETVEEATKYLKAQGINVTDVRQIDFRKIGVAGTPTLLAIDSGGNVKSRWIGQLSSDEENRVYKSLGTSRQNANQEKLGRPQVAALTREENSIGSVPVDSSELMELFRANPSVPIIDVRPREKYIVGHILTAINIPMDELEVRAAHEIPKDATVLFYCQYDATCETGKASEGVATECSTAEWILRKQGFKNIRVLGASLEQLKTAGVPVSRTTKVPSD